LFAKPEAGELPFNPQAGIAKKLKDRPLFFSFTMLHLHQFDIRYNDTIINNENAFDETKDSNFIFDKIFRHFVFAA